MINEVAVLITFSRKNRRQSPKNRAVINIINKLINTIAVLQIYKMYKIFHKASAGRQQSTDRGSGGRRTAFPARPPAVRDGDRALFSVREQAERSGARRSFRSPERPARIRPVARGAKVCRIKTQGAGSLVRGRADKRVSEKRGSLKH